MAPQLLTVPFGDEAFTALVRSVQGFKRADPLATVRLVVPSEAIGVAARRWLAGSRTDGRVGIAGLPIFTLRRLADLIATAPIAAGGRRPITGPILVGGIRGEVARRPGLFAPVADHPRTAQALADASSDLRLLDPTAIERVASINRVTGDVVSIHEGVRGSLSPSFYDETELLVRAADLVRGTRQPPTVLFLPGRLRPHERSFVAALAGAGSVVGIVGVTGTQGDGPVVCSVASALGVAGPGPSSLEHPLGTTVVSATDADDEVAAVVAEASRALIEGTPGHRIGLVYPTHNPYARLLHEHLTAAGITHYGRGVKPAAERRFGRAARGLLRLPERDFQRAEVMTWIADSPLAVPATRWDTISRQSGVVDGDWSGRLKTFTDRQVAKAAEDRACGQEEQAGWAENRATDAQDLAAFIASIQQSLGALVAPRSWKALSEDLRDLWCGLPWLRGASAEQEEQSVRASITAFIDQLARLDGTASDPGLAAAREMLEIELRSDLGRVGTIGHGVMVGPISDAAGLTFDLLCVLGLAEGVAPPIPAEDPLLPEDARQVTDGVLPGWRAHQEHLHRQLVASLGGAQRRVLSFARGDLRDGSMRVPSRWLMPTLRQLTDDPTLQAIDPLPRNVKGVVVRGSSDDGLLTCRPATPAQLIQRLALLDPAAVDPVSLAMTHDRSGGGFSRFTGLVGPGGPPLPSVGPSPTALQAYFACPYGYFVTYLLGVRSRDEPDDAVQMSAVDQGTLMHKVLENLIRTGPQVGFGEPWPPETYSVLDRLIDAEFREAERSGITGLLASWTRTKRILRADLHAWIAKDNALRSSGWKPHAPELRFKDLPVPLPGGEVLLLRGSADRVDIDADGNLRVLDYKSGGAKKYKGLSADNPTLGGRFLQLPLYALAARSRFESGSNPVQASYWFISGTEKAGAIGYAVSDEVLAAAAKVIAVAVHGHRDGLFPARPLSHSDGYDCVACSPDGLGERSRDEAFEELLAATAALAAYREVVGK